jgi:hypothetical protein
LITQASEGGKKDDPERKGGGAEDAIMSRLLEDIDYEAAAWTRKVCRHLQRS